VLQRGGALRVRDQRLPIPFQIFPQSVRGRRSGRTLGPDQGPDLERESGPAGQRQFSDSQSPDPPGTRLGTDPSAGAKEGQLRTRATGPHLRPEPSLRRRLPCRRGGS
jgi:hypothetical protein